MTAAGYHARPRVKSPVHIERRREPRGQ
jgi:hypothetical protein